MWQLTIYASSVTGSDNTPKKTGMHIKGLLTLTQTGGKIAGTYSGGWMGCRTAEVAGSVSGDGLELTFTCTGGTCLAGAGLSLSGKVLNTAIVGEVKPSGPAPSGKCIVYSGTMKMTRKK